MMEKERRGKTGGGGRLNEEKMAGFETELIIHAKPLVMIELFDRC
jgi:hypothetical protein